MKLRYILFKSKIKLFFKKTLGVYSVVERFVDIEEVISSILITPTNLITNIQIINHFFDSLLNN